MRRARTPVLRAGASARAPYLGAVALALGLALAPRAAAGAEAPAPAVSPLVPRSGSPAGCCCITDTATGKPPGCTEDLHEDKCRAAGSVVPTWRATFTPGKCPRAAERATPR